MTVGVAIIGASAIANAHVEKLLKLDGVQVKTIYSRSEERAREFAVRHALSAHTNRLEVVLDNPDVDAVIIATEPGRHVDLALVALAARKHILVEKPIDADLGKAREFQAELERHSRVVSVVSQKRFDPVLRGMKESLDRGTETNGAMVLLGMMWRRDDTYYRGGTGWRESGSDFFFNQGIHWLDVVNWFFGYPADIQAFALSGRPSIRSVDRCAGVLRYADGTLVSIYGGSFGDRSYADQFTIHRPCGRLDYQELRKQLEWRPVWSRIAQRFLSRRPPRWDLLAFQANDFIEAIRRQRPPTTSVAEAVSALRLAKALGGSI